MDSISTGSAPRPALAGEDASPIARRRISLVAGALVVAALAGTAYRVLPTAASESLFQIVAWGSLACFFWFGSRNGATGWAWWSIGIGFALFATGDVLFTLNEYVFEISPFPSVADVAYLAGYPCLALGLAILVRRSRAGGDRIALIDAGILVVPVAVATWIYLVEPSATGSGMSGVAEAVSAAYPLGDLLCLAVLVRLLLAVSGRGSRASRAPLTLLVLAFATMLAGDVWFLLSQLNDTYVTGGWNDALFLMSYVAIGACVMDPSVRNLEQHPDRHDPSPGSRRLVLLAIAALVTPVILLLQWSISGEITVPLVVAGTVTSFLLVVARMSGLMHALEDSRAQLAFDANHDNLTRLANRKLFGQRLDEVLRAGRGGALLFIDLDNFKRVNDVMGHQAGDALLVEVAQQLLSCVRRDDLVARLAGDEFVVLVPAPNQDAVYLMAERILGSLDIELGGGVGVTASIGLVTWPAGHHDASAQSLLNDADRAMYRAKDASGNQLSIQR